jgi:hypothetical protein
VVVETSTRDIAEAARDTAKANLAALQATSPAPSSQDLLTAMGQVLDAEMDLSRAQDTLDDATADQDGLAEQYRIMREEIFHTGEAATEARARLVAKGVTGARLDDFDQKAARLSTPEQIAALEAQY